jgi:hypothetical protein
MKVGNVQCNMVFSIVDIDSYDVVLGLDFLMNISIVVDMEKGSNLSAKRTRCGS